MKKILISLFVGFLGIMSFCQADGLIFLDEIYTDDIYSKKWGEHYDYGDTYNLICYTNVDCPNDSFFVSFDGNNNDGQYFNYVNQGSHGLGIGICTAQGESRLYLGTDQQCHVQVHGYVFSGFSSESCQSEYNLIPVENIDTNYCVSNDLCPENTGNSASWSELVINDIVHQSAPLININIPQEFDWSYTVDENEFDLGISGYNVDTDYIDGIITTQNAKPNSSDLNKIISELIPLFVPGLVIILFIRFVFKFVKKIF